MLELFCIKIRSHLHMFLNKFCFPISRRVRSLFSLVPQNIQEHYGPFDLHNSEKENQKRWFACWGLLPSFCSWNSWLRTSHPLGQVWLFHLLYPAFSAAGIGRDHSDSSTENHLYPQRQGLVSRLMTFSISPWLIQEVFKAPVWHLLEQPLPSANRGQQRGMGSFFLCCLIRTNSIIKSFWS